MTVRMPLSRLIFLLLVWMLGCAAACGLIYLGTPISTASAPHRTRPPEKQLEGLAYQLYRHR